MLLLVVATELEMQPLRTIVRGRGDISLLVAGMGPVETAVRLTAYLAGHSHAVRGVVNIGAGGGYPGTGVKVLDLCLANREVLGDFGICYDGRIEEFAGPGLAAPVEFVLDRDLLRQGEQCLERAGLVSVTGGFVTVQSASGTSGRGGFLRDRHKAICENMEGAAVARVCGEFGLPCLEMRCISNLVVDRAGQAWKLEQACARAAEAAAILVDGLLGGAPPG